LVKVRTTLVDSSNRWVMSRPVYPNAPVTTSSASALLPHSGAHQELVVDLCSLAVRTSRTRPVMTLGGPGPPHGREPYEPRPSLAATAQEYAGLQCTFARLPTRSSGRCARQHGWRAAALPFSSATRRPPPSCLLPMVSTLRPGPAASRLEPPAADASHPRSAHRGPRQGAAQDLHPGDDHDRSRRPAPRRAMTGGG
jgi:hypothetical protein